MLQHLTFEIITENVGGGGVSLPTQFRTKYVMLIVITSHLSFEYHGIYYSSYMCGNGGQWFFGAVENLTKTALHLYFKLKC